MTHNQTALEQAHPDQQALLACPFCGAMAERKEWGRGSTGRIGIRCSDRLCGAANRLAFAEDEALALWNTRTPDTELLEATVNAEFALLNWQKYNGEQGDEVVYQAEKVATSLRDILAALAKPPISGGEGRVLTFDQVVSSDEQARAIAIGHALDAEDGGYPPPDQHPAPIAGEMQQLVEHLNGPHEWGYRDPVVGGFIADDAPFKAADAIEALSRAPMAEGLEAVARIIDPWAFKNWQNLYDYCLAHGDGDEGARATADHMHSEARAAAMLKARAAIAAINPAILGAVEAERERVRNEVINTPETADFMAAVPIEAAHQRERWGADHDQGKSPFDWFWLIGYLAQKATSSAVAGDDKKALHHTISTAAALANWHAALAGADNRMVPGAPLPVQAHGDAAIRSPDVGGGG